LPKYKFHVISNTHWDREWRYPFQKNRQRLVEMIDRVLDILDQYPEYRAFHLDSQTVVLQDYLEIRPGRRAELEKFITERRLLVGPWYILPEEFQVGGESLIRNLLKGFRSSQEFGHTMQVGYTPFSWGQISQLPQIYQGFDIDVIMFYRGINSLDSPKAEFIWEGADGTRALTSRFSTWPRYNFYFYIYRPVVHNEQPEDIKAQWDRVGTPFHFSDQELVSADYALIRQADQYYPENLKPAVRKIIDDQVKDFTTRHIFWAQGHDTSGPNPKVVRIIKDINQFLEDGEVLHSTLEEYAASLKAEVEQDQLKIVKGERRSAQYDQRSSNLYGYTTSARMYLKQENFKTEKWLQYYAEPFANIARMLGMPGEDHSLERAWELLLQNSAHDSIGGCSLDEIHQDGMNRYKQCQEIAHSVFDRSVQYILQQTDLPGEFNLVVLNPLPFQRDAVMTAFIDIPKDRDTGNIRIWDGQQTVKLVINSSKAQKPILERLIDRPMYFDMHRYQVQIYVKEIPAMGYKVLTVKPAKPLPRSAENHSRTDARLPQLENQYLKVDLNANGTFRIYDKLNQTAYDNLGYLYDEGEAGHAWVHEPLEPFITTLAAQPEIQVVRANDLQQIVQVRYRLEIPKDLGERPKKNPETVPVPIIVNIVLNQNARRVELRVKLNNQAESHRLRLMFPTGLKAEYSHGEGQFDVVARKVARPDTRDWVEQPMYDYPMHHFVDLHDGQKGAAILVEGLKEYEVLDNAQRTVAITLLRSFNYRIPVASMQDYSHHKGTQCLGEHHYRLAFYPHRGSWESGQVFKAAMLFNYEPRLVQTGRGPGEMGTRRSFITVEPAEIRYSAFKKAAAGEGYILRVYNPGRQTVTGSVHFGMTLKSVFETNLHEKQVNKVSLINSQSIAITLAPKKIKSYQIIPE